MKLAYADVDTTAKVMFIVKDEVGSEKKARKKEKKWWSYTLSVFVENLELIFVWLTWEANVDIREFLKTLGIKWSEERVFDQITSFYKGKSIVAELIVSLEPRGNGYERKT